MNLVQKLPVGLGLAFLMMMSSCSKEDALTPEPVKSDRTDASMRGIPPILTAVPNIPVTYGATGSNVHAIGWERSSATSNDAIGLPTGTSSLTHLFGDGGLQWVTPLTTIPNAPYENSVLTISTKAKFDPFKLAASKNQRSAVEAKIKNLIPGKKYQITYHLASTICSVNQNGLQQAYTDVIQADWIDADGTSIAATVGLDDNSNWISQTVTFTATSTERILRFTAYNTGDDVYSYAHIAIGQNSVKAVH
ncbi:hypothetical protein [Dyadobacter alkalitolerans]|uniref:hypothetical protein n=1 Tax=Dyadobacter alkalitolerans TaxID=492736 RepID=UPI00047EFCB9|nr:hypothetical protein [Dyadobacter alkalitolerans]